MYVQNEKEKFMRLAILQAQIAAEKGEVPVGAVIVKGGEVIASAHNRRELDLDPTAHAEILALKQAGKITGAWNLSGCDIFVTLEPCAMCAGALINSRIDNIFYGASDIRFGCCGSILNLPSDPRFNHRPNIEGGILKEESLSPLQTFFKDKRKK